MVATTDFSQLELERYSRQIRIEGFGIEAQKRLKSSTVMISRVGGVGGTIAMNLARAGVGKLIIVHGGKIVGEYLNRMQLALPSDIG
ncbi:MAG: ThiF family adenylyltransferase, partial [Rivularia sp. ALOHA_DT_140]|nr:ThiF family adenylyltransferase [Rivularia sp. ALOHA_DT_140]